MGCVACEIVLWRNKTSKILTLSNVNFPFHFYHLNLMCSVIEILKCVRVLKKILWRRKVLNLGGSPNEAVCLLGCWLGWVLQSMKVFQVLIRKLVYFANS